MSGKNKYIDARWQALEDIRESLLTQDVSLLPREKLEELMEDMRNHTLAAEDERAFSLEIKLLKLANLWPTGK